MVMKSSVNRELGELKQLEEKALELLNGEASGRLDDKQHLPQAPGKQLDGIQRRNQAFLIRVRAALFQAQKFSFRHPNNKDEQEYKGRYFGTYTKALKKQDNGTGEVDPSAYEDYLKALQTGGFANFEAIPLGGTTKLIDPQAAYAFELEGIDTHGLTMLPAPDFDSAQEIGEIAEVYWQALARDVPFSRYSTDELTQAAAADLSNFSDFRGPKVDGMVTPAMLFRGDTPGDLAGPYLSQFLWADVPYGVAGKFPADLPGGGATPVPPNTQRRPFPQLDNERHGEDFMTDYQEWLNIQNGQPPSQSEMTKLDEANPRYIHTSRDLAEFVHRDYPYQTFVNAGLILLSYGPDALDPANPYLNAKTQTGFGTFGASDVLDLVARVANEALKAAWYQKWLVHRRLRPEEFGGWLENQRSGRANYPFNSEERAKLDTVLNEVSNRYGNYLLPQAFPEGCPTHPAYPSGHATYAGACVTVLKAFFKEDFPIPSDKLVVVANDDGTERRDYVVGEDGPELTIGGELNKLAANIAIGRDAAGVHWRTDASEGLKLGEDLAICFLQDRARLYNEPFNGFRLTKFDGTAISIPPNGNIITQQLVKVYQHANFGGRSQRFSPGVYRADRGDLNIVGNDTVSSLQVPAGLVARVCEHEDAGLCREYGPGDHDYVGDDLNDKISYIVVRQA